APSSPSSGNALPPVTVDEPQPRRASPQPARRPQQAARAVRRPAAGQGQGQSAQAPTTQSQATTARGGDTMNGYVAQRSGAGTKTNTPPLEVPQAISVIGRDQLKDQNARTIVEALRYTAGVSANTNPNDTRFESIRIRGFEPVLYLDGLQLPY